MYTSVDFGKALKEKVHNQVDYEELDKIADDLIAGRPVDLS